MEYRFTAFGHPNLRATHKSTLEFTKDANLTVEGDCIVGVNADFDPLKIREFAKSCEGHRMKLTLKAQVGKRALEDSVEARPNTLFNDLHELVIRKSDFRSGRTLGVCATKAANDLDRGMVDLLKNPSFTIEVALEKMP
jgi:hypothetical protein